VDDDRRRDDTIEAWDEMCCALATAADDVGFAICDGASLRAQWQDYRAFRVIRNRGARVGCRPVAHPSTICRMAAGQDTGRSNSCSREVRCALCELGSWVLVFRSRLAWPRLQQQHTQLCHLLTLFRAKEELHRAAQLPRHEHMTVSLQKRHGR